MKTQESLSTDSNRWIKLPEVSQLITYSRSSIYRLISEGLFPEPVRLTSRCVVWKLSTIQNWMREKEAVNQSDFSEEPKNESTPRTCEDTHEKL